MGKKSFQEFNLREERYKIVLNTAKIINNGLPAFVIPLISLWGGTHQPAKIIHLVEGRWRRLMTSFVNRNFAYIQRKQFDYPMQSIFYCGIEKRAYLDVKLLSSGCICKLLKRMQPILPHPQPHKFSAGEFLRIVILLSIFFFFLSATCQFTTRYVTVTF